VTQLSRPYQIGLVVLVLFVLVWFVALRHPSGESSSAPPATSTPVPAASHAGSTAAAGSTGSSQSSATKVYHGPVPGLEGLTRDISKAHQAVSESQQNAQELQGKSAQASGEAASAGAAGSSASTTASAAGATGSAASTTASSGSHAASTAPSAAASQSKTTGGSATGAGSHTEIPAHEAALESELSRGKVGVVLFWNDRASDDQKVHEELQSLSHSDPGIAVQFARPAEVTSFGSFTRTVQVVGTPTVLIVNRKRQVTALNGLTDTFSVQQAIGDASAGVGRVQAPKFTSWTPTSSRAKFAAQANHICQGVHGANIVKYESIGQLRSVLASATGVVSSTLEKVEGLQMPTQDRPFIHKQFDLVRAALQHFSASIAPGINPSNVLQRRAMILEGEADGDQATNSLEAYGVLYCG
jgi:hypothetical protein